MILKYGQTSDDIKKIQAIFLMPQTGYFDKNLKLAVEHFQRRHFGYENDIDGIVGNKTIAKLSEIVSKVSKSFISAGTQKIINTLHPSVRFEVQCMVAEVNREYLTGIAKVILTQGKRTFAEQDALYAKGRTVKGDSGVTAKKPLGNTVTNAKGGQSVHNYGFAVDIALLVDNKVIWDEKKDFDKDAQADWIEVVHVFKKYTWNWGGDWVKFKDLPHFDKAGYGDWKKLSKMPKDDNEYVIL